MSSEQDTIAAIATPPGKGAISLIRMSGSEALAISQSVFRPVGSAFEQVQPRFATFGTIITEDGKAVDEVLLTWFKAPKSYTGEDLVEISCHGGILVTQAVLARLLEAGARAAEGGEFTQRAFLNGKMDLTQAEAVMDVISAQTDLALRSANEQLQGHLGSEIEKQRQELIGVIAHLEAFIDFPDEDIDPDTGNGLAGRIRAIEEAVAKLTATADQGRILREGVRTVIAGAPNVGKSSLLNLLLGFERAIVSEIAGTTRDTIEEVINLGGIPLRLIDTAGVREAEDLIEKEGITRAKAQISDAELVLRVLDGSGAVDEDPEVLEISDSQKLVTILNKADLGEHSSWDGTDAIRLSCSTREGLEDLTTKILDCLNEGGADYGGHAIAINARHQSCLLNAAAYLQSAERKLKAGEPPEFTAIELRSALNSIGEVIGKTDIEEILGEIFGAFCIGK